MFDIKHLIKGNYMILKWDLIFYNFLNIFKKIFIIYQFDLPSSSILVYDKV